MGHLLPRLPPAVGGAQADDYDVPPYGRNPAPPRFQQPDGAAQRSRPQRPLADDIRRYLDTDTATAEERIRLFRLAWDVSCSAFAGRQTLYERYFGGDAARNAALLYQIYDRNHARNLVQDFLALE